MDPYLYVVIVSALGLLGKVDEAQAMWAELKTVNPDYSAREHIGRLPFRNAADPARIAEGLALAGAGGLGAPQAPGLLGWVVQLA